MSHNGNTVPPSHVHSIENSEHKANSVMKGNHKVTVVVNRNTTVYRNTYRKVVVNKYTVYNRYRDRHHDHYRDHWWHHGFYGYYYPIIPAYDIDDDYWNPAIYWFYCDDWDDDYYVTWYGNDYWTYPEYREHFRYIGVYYPTVAFRDLLVGISDLPAMDQINFRLGTTNLTEQLATKTSEVLGLPLSLDRNDIVVDHYQIMDGGAAVEGFVSRDDIQLPFKAVLDFNDPSQSLVFAPSTLDGDPSQDDLDQLQAVNDKIVDLGGDVETPDDGQLN